MRSVKLSIPVASRLMERSTLAPISGLNTLSSKWPWLPAKGTVFISVTDGDKSAATQLAAGFHDMGFRVVATGGTATASFEVTGVTFDSREVEAGHLFVAMPGTVHDGHQFVDAAFAAEPPAELRTAMRWRVRAAR